MAEMGLYAKRFTPVLKQSRLKDAVIELYRQGYVEAEIVALREALVTRHRLGAAWFGLAQSTVNRWLKASREADADLEIWHILNTRRWKPAIYTHWKPEGQIILPPFYDPIRDKMYLGAGMDFIPLGSRQVETVKSTEAIEQEKRWRRQTENIFARASPPIPVILKGEFDYSYRDIEKLSQGKSSRFPDRDKAPRVQHLVKDLTPMSHSAARRIVLSYGREKLESGVRKEVSTKVVDIRTGEIVSDWTQLEG